MSGLFQEMSESEIEEILSCLSSEKKQFEKEQTIYPIGDSITRLGMVLSGSVNILKNDIWGNQRIIDNIGKGRIFGETYACIKDEPLMVHVVAAEKTEVLFLDINRVLTTCPKNCDFHNRLIQNLLIVMAERNLNLTRKIDLLTQKSIRERIISYLSYEAVKQGKYRFDIPFNRQQMADYLSVERSALSGELSKMQKEGLIRYHKNEFELEIK